MFNLGPGLPTRIVTGLVPVAGGTNTKPVARRSNEAIEVAHAPMKSPMKPMLMVLNDEIELEPTPLNSSLPTARLP